MSSGSNFLPTSNSGEYEASELNGDLIRNVALEAAMFSPPPRIESTPWTGSSNAPRPRLIGIQDPHLQASRRRGCRMTPRPPSISAWPLGYRLLGGYEIAHSMPTSRSTFWERREVGVALLLATDGRLVHASCESIMTLDAWSIEFRDMRDAQDEDLTMLDYALMGTEWTGRIVAAGTAVQQVLTATYALAANTKGAGLIQVLNSPTIP